ncbi:MAG: adenylate/guanylate cyclase domain-containing protein [Ignavibacteriae bacterium]|nr:MAG: adenylate/guanylate cyclase domain-containing protein [Ignavibacteriota bacterium]
MSLRQRSAKHHLLINAAVGFGSALFVVFLWWYGVLDGLELKTLDFRFRHFTSNVQPSDRVVIAAIDEKSLYELKKNYNTVWKWPRDIYALLVEYFQHGGATAVAFDILFSDPAVDRLTTDGAVTDGKFADALGNAGNVVLAMQFLETVNVLTGDNPYTPTRDSLRITIANQRKSINGYPSAILPLTQFQKNSALLGFVNFQEDEQDGICRRIQIAGTHQDRLYFQLGVAAYLKSLKNPAVEIQSGKSFRAGDVEFPLTPENDLLISWYGRGGIGGVFRYYSIDSLIASALQEKEKIKPFIPSDRFKDKIVIIGGSAAGLYDFKSTPFTVYNSYPGMEITATVLSNLLQGDKLRRVNSLMTLLAVILFASFISFLFAKVHKIRMVVGCSFVLAVLWMVLALILFKTQNLWIDIAIPEAALMVTFAVSAVLSYYTEGRARKYLRNVFGRYLSPMVITEILDREEGPELGGSQIDGSVFFSDISSFTTISESMPPAEVVKLLNNYFTIATDILLQNEGLLDKYIGDAIMAVFGAPVEKQNHAYLACKTALEINRAVTSNFLERKAKIKLVTRFGITSGSMVVGNIGSERRLDYTAIGDTVNLASRLEGVNKHYGTTIIISGYTLERIGREFFTRELDEIRVKGKKEAICIHELIDPALAHDELFRQCIEQYDAGLKRYKRGEFREALRLFQSGQAFKADDGPTNLLIKRCENYLQTPPAGTWDGVTTLDFK